MGPASTRTDVPPVTDSAAAEFVERRRKALKSTDQQKRTSAGWYPCRDFRADGQSRTHGWTHARFPAVHRRTYSGRRPDVESPQLGEPSPNNMRRASAVRACEEVSKMTKRQGPWLFGFGLGVLVVLGATLALSAMPSARAEAPAAVTYADPVGDATNGGPDITQVAVSNDGDIVTLAITAAGDVDFARVSAWLDTDEDATAGDPPDGTDYALVYALDSGGVSPYVLHWVTNRFEPLEGTSMTFEKSGDTGTFTISASDLGGPKAFAFDLYTGIWSGDEYVAADQAPDSAPDTLWQYAMTPQPTRGDDAQPPAGAGALAGLLGDGSVYISGTDLMWHQLDPVTFAALGNDANTIGWFSGSLPGTIGDPVPAVAPVAAEPAPVVPLAETVNIVPVIGAPTPVKVTAGKTVVITFPVVNGVTGEKLTNVTTMASAPTIGGRLIRPHVERFTNGAASVGLKVPVTKGKQLKVKLTIKAGTATATRVATIPIA